MASAQWTFWFIGFLTVFLTGMYIFRGILVLFHHQAPPAHRAGPVHRAIQPQLYSPLHLLGILGGIGVSGTFLLFLWGWFAEFLSPVVGQRSVSTPGGFSVGMDLPLILAVGMALSGVAMGYLSFTKFSGSWIHQSALANQWYVHLLNKLYFDELYEVYIVQPTLRLAAWLWRVVDRQGFDALVLGIASVTVGVAKWLWRVVDLRGIDGLVVGLGQQSVGLARWLWRVVDFRGVDRVVVGIGSQSIGIANWLWNIIDIKVLDKNVDRLGDQTEAAAETMREMEPRTLQHHLLVMIFWLIIGMTLLFWFVV